MNADELLAKIEASVPCEDFNQKNMDGYYNAIFYAAKIILGIASREPKAFKTALDAYRQNPFSNDIDNLMTSEEKQIFEGSWGLTGFQWGEAVSAVAFLTEQEPVPNPAIIEL